jgi:tetratricopeptide (TPR) repeat protein
MQRARLIRLALLLILSFCSAAARGGEAPDTEATLRDSLGEAKRFFDSGGYVQARKLYDDILSSPPLANPQAMQAFREEALFYRARCLYFLPEQKEAALADFKKLAVNEQGLANPTYRDEARYWAGRTLLAAGKPKEACDFLGSLGDLGTKPELDCDSSRYLAQALVEQSRAIEGEGAETKKEALIRQAVQELKKVLINYPNTAGHQEVELDLMRLHMLLREYADGVAVADAVLARGKLADDFRARCYLYRAQCLYMTGRIDEAISDYGAVVDNETTGVALALDALYGRGWAYTRSAETVGLEKRPAFLAKAKADFRKALKKMPLSDPRRVTIMMTLSDVYLRMKEFPNARKQLQEILALEPENPRAHYLAGVAARGAYDYDAAVEHFEAVIRHLVIGEVSDFLLETLKSLADLERDRRDFGAALLYYNNAAEIGRMLRNYTMVANAELGAAVSLIGLGGETSERSKTETDKQARALLKLLADNVAGAPGPQVLKEMDHLEFRLRSLKTWMQAGPDNYGKALEVLALLRGRYLNRLPVDELDFVEGRARFLIAEMKKRELLASPAPDREKEQQVLSLYTNAAEVMARAAEVNPRGNIAPQANFHLGEILFERGGLCFSLADRLQAAGETPAAQSNLEEGRKIIGKSLSAYSLAVKTAADVRLRSQSRRQLGRAYFRLEEFRPALQEFRTLATDPASGEDLRLEATIWWAKSLIELGDPEAAVARLRPETAKSIEASIMAGDLLEKLKRPRDAYLIYMSWYLIGKEVVEDKRALAAEALYRGYYLELSQAGEIERAGDIAETRRHAAVGLRQVALKYPETAWAAKALTALGEYLLVANPEEALKIADTSAKELAIYPDAVQAMELLRGKALHRLKRYQEAMSALEQAEAVGGEGENFEIRRAASILEKGHVALSWGKVSQAIDFYRSVFARFPKMTDEADAARLALARLLAGQNELAQALKILDNGYRRELMLQEKTRLKSLHGGK